MPSKRETPIDWDESKYDEPATYAGSSRRQPDTILQALMETPPGAEPDTSLEEVEQLRDIVAAAWDALEPRDVWILNALFVQRMSLRQLGTQLSMSKTHVARLRDGALERLREQLQHDPTIREYLER